MKPIGLICVMVLWLCIGANSHAADATIHHRGTWFFSWSGLPFAKLWIDQQEADGRYQMVASFKSRGLLRMFKSVKTFSKSNGLRGEPRSQTLLFDYKNNTDGKITILAFNEDGSLQSRNVKPEDDPTYRPPVTPEQLKNVVTPGNALLAMRDGMVRANKTQHMQFDTLFYEGKRLMRVHAKVGPKQQYAIEGIEYPVQALTLRRELVAGFTEKEKKRAAEGEPAAVLYLHQNDGWPIALEVPIKLGLLKAYWVAE